MRLNETIAQIKSWEDAALGVFGGEVEVLAGIASAKKLHSIYHPLAEFWAQKIKELEARYKNLTGQSEDSE